MLMANPKPVIHVTNERREWWRRLTGRFRNAQPENNYRRMRQLFNILRLKEDAGGRTVQTV